MGFDIQPLQRALRALSFTIPLDEGDPSYVERSDGLGQKILDHIMVPSTHRLLLAGPAGCGKSTELLQIHKLAYPTYAVFVCPCDRDLDLYRFDPVVLVMYLAWRMVVVAKADGFTLTNEIQEEVLGELGTTTVDIGNPRMFFSRLRIHAVKLSSREDAQRHLPTGESGVDPVSYTAILSAAFRPILSPFPGPRPSPVKMFSDVQPVSLQVQPCPE